MWLICFDNVDIIALAVFTGGQNEKRPDFFHKSFLGTEIHYKYNAYHILDHTENQLMQMRNPFAPIVLAAQKVLLTNKIPYNNEPIERFLFSLKTFIYIHKGRKLLRRVRRKAWTRE